MKAISPLKYAEKYGIGYHTVLKLCRQGKLKTFKLDGGHYRIFDGGISKEEQQKKLLDERDLLQIESNNKSIANLTQKNNLLFENIKERGEIYA